MKVIKNSNFREVGHLNKIQAYEFNAKKYLLTLGDNICKRFDYKSCKENEDLKQNGDYVAGDYLKQFGLFIIGTTSKEDDNVFVINANNFKKQFKIRGQSMKSPHKLE